MHKASVAMAAGLAALFISTGAMAGKDLDTIKARGALICGIGQGTAGFMLQDSQGKWIGLDVDVCRAVSAAIFGDAEKVKYVPLSSQQRFTALQSGEVDVLSNNTTITLTRDTALGLDFTAVTYYDGQGFLVNKKLGVKSAKELNGATVCVAPGTTTELNLADYFRANKMTFKPVVIEKVEEVRAAFFAGRCDVYTNDSSSLYATRAAERAAARDGGRLHRPAGDHLQGAAGAGGAPRRQPVRRHRALVAVRHARGRGIRHFVQDRGRDAEERESLDQAHPRRDPGHGQGARRRPLPSARRSRATIASSARSNNGTSLSTIVVPRRSSVA